MRHVPRTSWAVAPALALALACAHAQVGAATSSAPAEKEGRVLVTGSRIPRRLERAASCLPDTSSPVVIYPGEALMQSWPPGNLAAALAHPVPAAECPRPDGPRK